MSKLKPPSEEVADRFWEKVDMEGDCWVWKAAIRDSDGLGVFGLDGTTHYAHRVAFVIARGPIPDGFEVRRSCNHAKCVRPLHLMLVEAGQGREEPPTPERWLI